MKVGPQWRANLGIDFLEVGTIVGRPTDTTELT